MNVYHGTNIIIDMLKEGSWITTDIETARSFGKNIYVLQVNDDDVDWEYLDPDWCDWDTGGGGEWIGTIVRDINCNKI